jgi:glyoxylase-like metal-dependent hydrolase (beta-lactamase superfamily II)
MNASIHSFFDEGTSTVTHIIVCPVTRVAAIVDSVLDFDVKSGRTSAASADRVGAFVVEHKLAVHWHLETHAHADHLTAAPYLQERFGGKIAVGAGIRTVQKVFGSIFNLKEVSDDGAAFDHLFSDGEEFSIGQLKAKVLETPGHTPACVSYLIGLDAFVGDTLFMPDYGTARCDFPGGDARTLYQSIRKLLSLPAATKLHMCHDYRPGGREARWVSTVAEQRAANIHMREEVAEDAFVALRSERDSTLPMPALMLPSVQVNIRAGHLPEVEDNGRCYLKIPINAF